MLGFSAYGDVTTCDGIIRGPRVPEIAASTSFDITGAAGAVPEPATLALFSAGRGRTWRDAPPPPKAKV